MFSGGGCGIGEAGEESLFVVKKIRLLFRY